MRALGLTSKAIHRTRDLNLRAQAFVKSIYTMQLSPAILKVLRMAMSRRKKKPVLPAGIRSTTSLSGARAPQRLPSLLAGKRKANELASSGDSSQPAIRRPAPDARSGLCPRTHRKSRANTLHFTAGTSCPPREGRRTRLSWPGPPPLIRQVGRSSTQPWIQTRLNPLSRTRQSIGACLATCPGL